MNSLVGTWKLKEFEITNPSTKVSKMWRMGTGEGLLIYTHDGYMSVSINADTSTFPSESNPQAILDRCLFYSGSYVVLDTEVVHHVKYSTNPNRIGKELKRSWEMSKNLLILRSIGDDVAAKVTWERV